MTLPYYLVVDCSAEVTTYAHPEYDLDLFDAAGLLSAKVYLTNSICIIWGGGGYYEAGSKFWLHLLGRMH
jgi:hypothetical protein